VARTGLGSLSAEIPQLAQGRSGNGAEPPNPLDAARPLAWPTWWPRVALGAILVLVLGAWVFALAAERGSLRLLLLATGLVDVAFNVKMMAGFVPLPAFYLLYLLTAPRGSRARSGHLTLVTVVLLVVSLSWALAVELTPPDRWPYVGSSSDNSVLDLVIGYNGLDRVLPGRSVFRRSGQPTAPAQPQSGPAGPTAQGLAGQEGNFPDGPLPLDSGAPGPLRLFN
jgi:4-amino-4-deoxy-L-arabinose transferase-like glycosyltransferase